MLIICSREEKKEIESTCDGRCHDDRWCPFTRLLKCPINDGHIKTIEEIGINTIFHDNKLR